ncbi:hypothetical protein [Lewinella cohaerens]|uniref:hypothetical protein n=1 Tax=Lewinella cohaerens TaxID=70995 RepID=UPI00039A5B74|nr:hypothetical protein [Lewinella cohaerens]
MYDKGGLDAVRKTNYGNSRHELSSVYQEVEQTIEQSSCNTLEDVRDLLCRRFDY